MNHALHLALILTACVIAGVSGVTWPSRYLQGLYKVALLFLLGRRYVMISGFQLLPATVRLPTARLTQGPTYLPLRSVLQPGY